MHVSAFKRLLLHTEVAPHWSCFTKQSLEQCTSSSFLKAEVVAPSKCFEQRISSLFSEVRSAKLVVACLTWDFLNNVEFDVNITEFATLLSLCKSRNPHWWLAFDARILCRANLCCIWADISSLSRESWRIQFCKILGKVFTLQNSRILHTNKILGLVSLDDHT